MNRLVYERLSHRVLWYLLEGGHLRAASPDRMISYQVYCMPPAVLLFAPDEDAYVGLLNRVTRAEHCEALAEALLHLVSVEERDDWVLLSPGLEIVVRHAEDGRARAIPVYDLSEVRRELEESARVSAAAQEGQRRAIVRVRWQWGGRDQEAILQQGDGVLALLRGRRLPRLTLYERPGDAYELAALVAQGWLEVESASGQSSHQPYHPVSVTHDMRFKVRPLWWRFWERSTVASVELLGVVREQRRDIAFVGPGGESYVWRRNAEAQCVIGDARDALWVLGGLDVVLRGLAFDRIEVENRGDGVLSLTWLGGYPLELATGSRICIQGRDLRGIGYRGGRLEVSSFREPEVGPRLLEVHGVSRRQLARKGEASLFGFEQPVAEVYQVGLGLETLGEDTQRVDVTLSGRELGPLFVLALDGCPGAKIRALREGVRVGGSVLSAEGWRDLGHVVRIETGGGAFRLEAVDELRLLFEEEVKVAELSDDPRDKWNYLGWRFRPQGGGLVLSGGGRVPLVVDGRVVKAEAVIPGRREHRVEGGGGIFRIVCHRSESGERGEEA